MTEAVPEGFRAKNMGVRNLGKATECYIDIRENGSCQEAGLTEDN